MNYKFFSSLKIASILLLASASTVSGVFIPKSSTNLFTADQIGSLRKGKQQYIDFDLSSNLGRGRELSDGTQSVLESSRGGSIANSKTTLIAPTIYTVYTAMLTYIIYQLRDALVLKTLGSKALALVTGALIWDNGVIAIGSFFFRDASSNPTKYNILKLLSYPRFTLHAVGVPLQCVTVAEMGKAAGIGFLQSKLVQMAIALVAVIVVSRIILFSRILFGHSHLHSTKYRISI